MMTMACCGVRLPFCALLLLLLNAAFQTSDAIPCERSDDGTLVRATGYITVDCPKTCVLYSCGHIHNTGCSSHFYDDCRGSDSAFAFIKSKTPEKLVYNDNHVTYISGCENKDCLSAKRKALDKEFAKRTPSPANPLWYYETPGDIPQDERKDIQCDRSLHIDGESKSDIATFKVGCPFCIFYRCGKKKGYGCPADFKVNCADYPKSIAAIQSKTPEQLNYDDGYITYVSGCNDEKKSKKCLDDKAKVLQAEKEKHEPTLNNPILYFETPGDVAQPQPVHPPNAADAAYKVSGMMLTFLGLIFAQFY